MDGPVLITHCRKWVQSSLKLRVLKERALQTHTGNDTNAVLKTAFIDKCHVENGYSLSNAVMKSCIN